MKKIFSRNLAAIVAIILFCAVLVWFFIAVKSADNAARTQQLEAVRRSVENGITLCYSIEGVYPSELSYLAENYGVNYDSERFLVHYDCFAANVRPLVTVIEKES